MTDRKGYPRGQLLRAGRSRDPHIDEVAVERACHGDPVNLTVAERGEAIRRLTAWGLNAKAIAERLRMNDRTVYRHRRGDVWHSIAREEAA